MASTNTLNVEINGFRNVIIRATQISDGTDGEAVTIYNATSSGAYGVSKAGQTFYPGVHTTIVGLSYDCQDMKMRLMWEATADQDILVLGGSPDTFKYRSFGGIRVPSGLAGATGSIKVVSYGPQVGASYSVVIHLRKNVPVS